jgi:hypothetical protein
MRPGGTRQSTTRRRRCVSTRTSHILAQAASAADRGDDLFSGKAQGNNCHVEPLWTDPGWNLHTPAEICIDDFLANRAPDVRYRTLPIGALFTHVKSGFSHDGRFPTLDKVVDHYNTCMNLNLSTAEKSDLLSVPVESHVRRFELSAPIPLRIANAKTSIIPTIPTDDGYATCFRHVRACKSAGTTRRRIGLTALGAATV